MLSEHPQVLLVRVKESHLQRKPVVYLGVRGYQGIVDSEGVVVRCYKGDWKVGERILLHEQFDFIPDRWERAGELRFIMTDKHVRDRIDIGIEDRWDYQPEFDRALQLSYSGEVKQ